jgi:putative NADH-flavin reductase
MIKKNENLDWTFFSPAIEMHQGTAGVRKGTYRTALENPVFDENGRSVLSVEDVAVALVDELENGKFVNKDLQRLIRIYIKGRKKAVSDY